MANKIVGVPCVTGSHHRHRGDDDNPNHLHHSTHYWFDSDEDDSTRPSERVLEIRCGMAHDAEDLSITSWGSYGTVGWIDEIGRFTFSGDNTTGRGKFTDERVKYCNRLMDDDESNAGAYPPFEGVPDNMCREFFLDAEHPRPAEAGAEEGDGGDGRTVESRLL